MSSVLTSSGKMDVILPFICINRITSIFPDDVNTDDIIPAWTLQESTEKSYFAKYAFSKYDSSFISRSKEEVNNIIVAGENFGCGSSREQAIYALQENKVRAVIAKSFPDIFYRNALNNGLILISLSNIKPFKISQELVIDLEKKIIILDSQKIPFQMGDNDGKTFSTGGKLNRVRKHLKEIKKPPPGRSLYSHLPGVAKRLLEGGRQAQTRHDSFQVKYQSQTIVEKIISDHVGKPVFAGEKLDKLPIDILFLNEVIGPPAIKDFMLNFPKTSVFNQKKIFFIPDHTVPSSSIAASEGITFMEEFAKKQRIKCYKEGDGIEHVVLIEDGYIVPGEIILGTDSHTDTNGALNTLAFGIGTTDGNFALATGHLYDFEVPKTLRVNLCGKFQKGVYAKDLILHLIGQLGVDGALKKVVEFGGVGLKNLSMDARTTIANMVVEMGGRTAIFESDQVLENYLRKRAKFPYKPYLPDKNCNYDQIIDINLSKIEPCVAFPHKPSYVTFISKIKDYMKKSRRSKKVDFARVDSLKISDAFLGACTNGRYEDFVEAAKILKGKRIHPDVNFVAIPASRNVYNRLLAEGVFEIFAKAGVNIESSNCGPCFGKHMGVVGRGAQMISSSNRNYIGRMGSSDAKIFLASPVTVAASAVAGEIVDPRKYL